MTPHDRGIEALVSDPSLLGLSGISKVDAQIPLFDTRFWTLTDIDVVYELRDGRIAIAELKTGTGSHWLKALQQLTIGSQYVYERYGVNPVSFYVHGAPGRFTVIRTEVMTGYFEPVGRMAKPGILKMVRKEFPKHAERIPREVAFYGSRMSA